MQDAGIVIARLHGRVTQRFCRIRIQRRPLDAPDPADMLGTGIEPVGQRLGAHLAGKAGDLNAVGAGGIQLDGLGDGGHRTGARQDQAMVRRSPLILAGARQGQAI